MLNWILVPSHIEWLLAALALATPLGAAVLLAAGWRRLGAASMRQPLFWIAAAAGPLVFGLWRVYNLIEDKFGLDSLAALGINAALFLAAGCAIGAILRRARSR